MMRRPPTSTLPYTLVTDTTLFRSGADISRGRVEDELDLALGLVHGALADAADRDSAHHAVVVDGDVGAGIGLDGVDDLALRPRSEKHTSELQSLMPISYALFRLQKNYSTLRSTNHIFS